MSDLISRNEVIKIIDKIGYVNCECNKDFKANSRVDKIRQNVVEMPTALDLDEVMEELNQYRQIGTVDECNTAMGYVTPIKIGDIIYKIPSKTNYKINIINGHAELNHIYQQKVTGIKISKSGLFIETCDGMDGVRPETLGDCWFLKECEAERKLKEMEE